MASLMLSFLDSEIVAEALRNQTKPIKEVLDGVLSVMAEAVEGLWSFQMLENSGQLKIVDSNLIVKSSGISKATGCVKPTFKRILFFTT